jgi:hypothetical protein
LFENDTTPSPWFKDAKEVTHGGQMDSHLPALSQISLDAARQPAQLGLQNPIRLGQHQGGVP